MKRLLLLSSLTFVLLLCAFAQDGKKPFKGTFFNKENNIRLEIDLYDTTVVVPAYSFLGAMNGYMTGKLYDAWFVTAHNIKKNKATVKLSNDLGADTQELLLYFNKEGKLVYETQGGNVIRRAENGKWVKLPERMLFDRKK